MAPAAARYISQKRRMAIHERGVRPGWMRRRCVSRSGAMARQGRSPSPVRTSAPDPFRAISAWDTPAPHSSCPKESRPFCSAHSETLLPVRVTSESFSLQAPSLPERACAKSVSGSAGTIHIELRHAQVRIEGSADPAVLRMLEAGFGNRKRARVGGLLGVDF